MFFIYFLSITLFPSCPQFLCSFPTVIKFQQDCCLTVVCDREAGRDSKCVRVRMGNWWSLCEEWVDCVCEIQRAKDSILSSPGHCKMKLLTSSSPHSSLHFFFCLPSPILQGRWRNITMEPHSLRLDPRCVCVFVFMCVWRGEEANKRAEGSSVQLLLFLVSVETHERPATELMLSNGCRMCVCVCVYIYGAMSEIEMSRGLCLWYSSWKRFTLEGHIDRETKE